MKHKLLCVFVALTGLIILFGCGGEQEGTITYDDCREVVKLTPNDYFLKCLHKKFTCMYVKRASGNPVSKVCVYVELASGGLLSNSGKCETAYVYFGTEKPDSGCTEKFPYLGRNFCYSLWGDADESLYVKAEDERFKAYGDGVVLDKKTKLMWAAKDNGYDINSQDAKSYFKNFQKSGYKDWRMPTKDELAGLCELSVTGNNGYHLTNLIELSNGFLWASDTRGSEVANFDFNLCNQRWSNSSDPYESLFMRVLPVRSAK
jgi:hypothetical protein